MDDVYLDQVVCPVCGFQYDSTSNSACAPCPLNSGCAMACCPACGHTTINTRKSSLVQLFQKLFSGKNRDVKENISAPRSDVSGLEPSLARGQASEKSDTETTTTLDEILPGNKILVNRFHRYLSTQHKLRLQAFGVEPGHEVEILQQVPVTIIKIDHTELAIERHLAEKILVVPA